MKNIKRLVLDLYLQSYFVMHQMEDGDSKWTMVWFHNPSICFFVAAPIQLLTSLLSGSFRLFQHLRNRNLEEIQRIYLSQINFSVINLPFIGSMASPFIFRSSSSLSPVSSTTIILKLKKTFYFSSFVFHFHLNFFSLKF